MTTRDVEAIAELVYQKLKTNVFSELATKTDLAGLGLAMKEDMVALGNHFDRLASEFKVVRGRSIS